MDLVVLPVVCSQILPTINCWYRKYRTDFTDSEIVYSNFLCLSFFYHPQMRLVMHLVDSACVRLWRVCLSYLCFIFVSLDYRHYF